MNRNLLILIAVVVILAGGAYYYFNSSASQNLNPSPTPTVLASESPSPSPGQSAVEIKVDAKRWEFTPSIITVKKGQLVKITINNTDTVHGINLPDFNVSSKEYLEFTPDKTGEFVFKCDTFCGSGHQTMQGKLIVTE